MASDEGGEPPDGEPTAIDATSVDADPPAATDGAPTVVESIAESATAILPAAAAPPAEIEAPARPSQPLTPSVSITSAADALRDEEIERTRLFIVMGWVVSVLVTGTVFVVDAPRVMSIVLVSALAVGVLVSSVYYAAFADPRNYTERALVLLAVMCAINGHIAVLYYGTYSAAPLCIVIGIHFVARTELERVARWIVAVAVVAYTAISIAIISGAIADPGVFASDRAVDRPTLAVGSVFVLGAYLLAYSTARTFRAVSLTSIEELRRATHLASQREALMEELRADLERALQVGGPGRYTDQTVGHFRLGIVIGRGAMGEVYEASHVETQAPAAVKLLRREMLADATQVARFLREVRASEALTSPHVVRVLETASAEDPLPYLAMERLHGRTLAERLRHEPRLSPAATLELCRHVGLAIDQAADAGIVHRDLKPQNLFCTADGVWKVLDFGVASLAQDTGTLTRGDVIGTPHYMAPEQAQGRRVDRRADTYALAAVAYRCLTGRYPFTAPDTPSLLYAVVHRMPARPTSVADLPPDVDRWFALALAKSPEARFATAAAQGDALAAALAGELEPGLRRRADALLRRTPWEAA